MQHRVLARKLRPQDFQSLIGQEHIKRALSNAIANKRLHHAYLFSGTRGVGKTSLARIITKCLNCETGITPTPCNRCQTCNEITTGAYPDLLEIDAASRTKVEDTRELLEQIQYAPIKGRFKVFLIDEVHMLSGHSFNALLKTLEEPPEHIKFLLATTDPQKLPITVLSRCLQFNLQPIPKVQISQYLAKVLAEENIKFENSALDLLASGAEGSLRDALSLTDQAIAFCGDSITADEVANILGISPRKYLAELLRAIIENQPKKAFATLAQLEAEGANFAQVLKEFAHLLHSLGYAQILPDALTDSSLDKNLLVDLANKASPEEIQLYYQFAIEGRRDLPLAPDDRCGAEICFMRMLAFKPIGKNLDKALPEDALENSLIAEKTPPDLQKSQAQLAGEKKKSLVKAPLESVENKVEYSEKKPAQAPLEFRQKTSKNIELNSNEDWINLYLNNLELDSMLQALLGKICFFSRQLNRVKFEVLSSGLLFFKKSQIQVFEKSLQTALNEHIEVDFIEVEELSQQTPLDRKNLLRKQQKDAEIKEILGQPKVQKLIELFGAKLEIQNLQ